MNLKRLIFFSMLILISALWSCQKDIPLLGEENTDSSKTQVFITAISLSHFNAIDPNTTLPWDDGSVFSFDSLDYTGPDIFFKFYYKSDVLAPMSYRQPSHFANADAATVTSQAPLVYYLTNPFEIPSYYIDTTFYLQMLDVDFNDPINDSTLMDSIPFTVGQDSKNNPYIVGTGFNGSQVTMQVLWK